MPNTPDPTVIFDPTSEHNPIGRYPARRLNELIGTIGLVDISKPRGDVFLDEVEHLVSGRYPNVDMVRFRKPTFTKPAPADFRVKIAERCKAVIQALAD
jgi:hypothetical protein